MQHDSGLSHADYEILVRLSEAPEHALRMSELAARTLFSRSRLSHAVGRLEREGLVRREPYSGDRRGLCAVLTEKGWGALEARHRAMSTRCAGRCSTRSPRSRSSSSPTSRTPSSAPAPLIRPLDRLATVLSQVTALRYVTPLREGGSLPGLMEGDDDGTYVVKFTGAGQGPRTLVAEVDLRPSAARARASGARRWSPSTSTRRSSVGEPDEEVQDLLRASPGRNLGMDFLPGALDLDVRAFPIEPELAGRILWFDALVGNVDRSWRNPNMLRWHGRPYLIDHGATLTFAHHWPGAEAWITREYDAREHALITGRPQVQEADRALAPLITRSLVADAVAEAPDEWLEDPPTLETFGGLQQLREAYVRQVIWRLEARQRWLPGTDRKGRRVSDGRSSSTRCSRWCRGWSAASCSTPASCSTAASSTTSPSAPSSTPSGCAPSTLAADPEPIRQALRPRREACAPAAETGRDARGQHFRWLTAPRSTVIQPGPVHTGLTDDPAAEHERLMRLLVRPVGQD